MIAWRIWHARNEVTHDKDLPAIEGSRRFICSYMHSLENIRRSSPEQIVKGKQVLRIEAVEKHTSPPKVHAIWSRPSVGELKLNVDGGFIARSGCAGSGMILRRNDGTVVFSACRSLHLCSSALEAELQACLDGLRFALDMSQERITIETDCAELVQLAISKERDGSILSHLVDALRILLSLNQVVAILKIPRLCNSASHELARYGMLNQISQVWVGSVPDFLRDHIQKDCNNSLIM